jgi:hypothetical protein
MRELESALRSENLKFTSNKFSKLVSTVITPSPGAVRSNTLPSRIGIVGPPDSVTSNSRLPARALVI